jgi:hypothetical protein
MAYVLMTRTRVLVIVHARQAYAPSRVRDAAVYLLQSSASTEDEQRLANEAREWLRRRRDEPTQTPVEQKRKGTA